MTKSHENIEWICKLHDDLIADEKREVTVLEKHYGHKPDVLARKLKENTIVYEIAHEMLDHMHIAAVTAQNTMRGMVTIDVPQLT
tara:strand:- start:269 stop:523 length:255 start_codon:yes stop_codon:yes gene_type:complete